MTRSARTASMHLESPGGMNTVLFMVVMQSDVLTRRSSSPTGV